MVRRKHARVTSATAKWISARMDAARDQPRQDCALATWRGAGERLSQEVEAVIAELLGFHLARARNVTSSEIAVLATGGFGRRDVAPYSDLTLLFLCAKAPDSAVKTCPRILIPLWDAKVDAGHAVRSVSDALALPAKDLAAATALLDARFLTGRPRLSGIGSCELSNPSGQGFARQLCARLRSEQYSRHSRFGDTIFMLEPDLKNGPGGLRDLCVGRWAAQVRFATADPHKLTRWVRCRPVRQRPWSGPGLAPAGSHCGAPDRWPATGTASFRSAGEHCAALPPGRHHEARQVRPAVAPAVEALMHDFQRPRARGSRETERPAHAGLRRPQSSPDRAHYVRTQGRQGGPELGISDGTIEVKENITFENRPSEMIRLFSLAIDSNLVVGRRTADLVAECAATRAAFLREDPEAAACFLQVLVDPRDAGTPSRLEQMHDLGLISALIPEWEPLVGRVQHDLYHVYTVDQHSLYAVATLKAIARGEIAADYPQVSAEFPSFTRRLALFVAVLLHDVGKRSGRRMTKRAPCSPNVSPHAWDSTRQTCVWLSSWCASTSS